MPIKPIKIIQYRNLTQHNCFCLETDIYNNNAVLIYKSYVKKIQTHIQPFKFGYNYIIQHLKNSIKKFSYNKHCLYNGMHKWTHWFVWFLSHNILLNTFRKAYRLDVNIVSDKVQGVFFALQIVDFVTNLCPDLC